MTKGTTLFTEVTEVISDDLDLLLHYITKSSFNGNFSCSIDKNLEKCLEVGFSAGFWMMEMAADHPGCQFYGIESEPRAPDLVFPGNCFFEKGDYTKGLPYEDGVFDLVRFQTFLKPVNSFLLSEIVRVTKKGGCVEILNFNLTNLGPLLSRLLKIYEFKDNLDQLSAIGLTTNHKLGIPLDWKSAIGEFSLSALRYLIENLDPRTRSTISSNEEDLFCSIEKECEKYNSHINIFCGYFRK